MSTSRDNLPVVEEPLPIVLDERTKKTLTDVRWLLALGVTSIAAVVVATASTIAFAQDAGVKAVAPVEARQTVSEAAIAQLQKDSAEQGRKVANVERVVMTLDLNMRLMLESRGIKPIDVPNDPDGGR